MITLKSRSLIAALLFAAALVAATILLITRSINEVAESGSAPSSEVPAFKAAREGNNDQDGASPTVSRGYERKGTDLKSVSDFVNNFDSIDKELTGLELKVARMELMDAAVKSLSIDDLQELAELFRDRIYHSELSGHIAVRFAQEDPQRGMEWLIAESSWEDSSSASFAFAAACDFHSFPLEDLNNFASNKKKALFIKGLVDRASFDVRIEALRYLQDNPEVSRLDGNLVTKCFEASWESGKFKEALEMYSVLDNHPLKRQILGGIFERAAYNDPLFAKALLADIQDDREKTLAITSIASSWGGSEPGKVAEWIDQLETIQEQDAAKEGLVMSLTHSDPASALEWAKSLNDDSRRESLLSKLVETLSLTDPQLLE